MKKILSMILALCMVMSFMTVAFADKTVCAQHTDDNGNYHCDICDIPLDHTESLSASNEEHWTVCPKDRTKVSEPAPHEWVYYENPTKGTHKKVCKVCNFGDADEACVGCQLTGGCELCGSKLLGIHPDTDNNAHCDGCEYPLDHEDDVQHDKEKHWVVCSLDETKIFLEGEHNWGEWEVVKEATEDAEGEKVRACEFCEREEKASIDKLPHVHKYTHNSKVVEPTCEDKGYTENFCKCGASEKVNYVDAKDHTWGEWKVTKEATYKEKGEKTRTCTIESCKKTETAEIDKVAHKCEAAEELKNKKDATCTKDGYTGDTVCKHCDAVMKQGEIVSPTGHDEKNAKLVDKVDATCKKAGYTGDLQCQLCKEIIKKGEAVKKLDHKFDSKTDKCTMCGLDKKDYNPKTGDNIMIIASVMGASMIGLVACAFVYKKKFAYQAKRVEK